jgi:hypothetical protein
VAIGRDVLSGDPAALQRYLDIVGDAFTNGFNVGMAVSSAMALLAALAIMRFYPRDTRAAGAPLSADQLAQTGQRAGGVGTDR